MGDHGITARMYESSYFAETERITIVIKAANWLPKDKERGTISYEHRNVENLPENTTIEEMKLNDDHSLTLQIKAPLVTDDTGAYFSSVPGTVYEIGTRETVLGRNGFSDDADLTYFLIRDKLIDIKSVTDRRSCLDL